MNLQQLLTYRTSCLIHDLPMKLYVHPEIKNRDVPAKCQQTDSGLSVWMKNNKPLMGAHFNFNGEFSIKKNQNVLNRLLRSPVVIGVMCRECRAVPSSIFSGNTTLNNIENLIHFYTFVIKVDCPFDTIMNNHIYKCLDLSETIRYHSADKFYRVTGHPPDGSAIFQMGTLGKIKIRAMIEGMMNLTVPKFDISNIKSIDQLTSKIKLYNLFS